MRIARWVAEALASSWRYHVTGEEYPRDLRAAEAPVIYVTWHAQMLPALWRHRGDPMTLLVSAHQDGGKLADAVSCWG